MLWCSTIARRPEFPGQCDDAEAAEGAAAFGLNAKPPHIRNKYAEIAGGARASEEKRLLYSSFRAFVTLWKNLMAIAEIMDSQNR
jgi:hypothetical protein